MAPKSVTFRRHDHLVSVLFGDLLSHSYNITFSMFLDLVEIVLADNMLHCKPPPSTNLSVHEIIEICELKAVHWMLGSHCFCFYYMWCVCQFFGRFLWPCCMIFF